MVCAIVELVKLLYEDFDAFCEKLKKFEEAGVISDLWIDKKNGIVGAIGPTGTGVAIIRTIDPINAFVLLNLLFYGQYFIYLPDLKEAFKQIKKYWKELKREK